MKASFKDMVIEIAHLFFPFYALRRANKIVDKKIEDLENGGLNFSYMLGYEKLTPDIAEKYLIKTFESRKSLEDKAKANVFGVTIAVSMIVGFSQIFANANFHASGFAFKVITISLVFYSLLSVSIGTILSLLVLGKYNRVYDIFPQDVNTKNDKLQLLNIAVNAELNSLYNVKRNNILYSSYGLIINFLVALSISFLIVIMNPKQQDLKQEVSKLQMTNMKNEHSLTLVLSDLATKNNENKLLLERVLKLEKEGARVRSQLRKIGDH